ncbi:ubiquinol-cytochrome C chaperone family protein [Blastomonas sp.]|uniref:ubiquinol-cytochrome C chaperone family protein n=1 Tax=Blastomonas sp. TaxID=1909299 RepID=UPI0026269F9B|nr:ubiquinol-cytochrome C chaperone family protein [Blastomonas sp.]MDM7958055.1 ubiquinol-cytochrome C chaperone family protein [Blastomonas sp.]
MSVLSRIFARKDPREQARPAYDRVVALGRDPYWYLDGGVPDSVDGRFETVMTVLCAVLLRLEADDADNTVRHFSVYLAELFVDDMDGQLRQNGVGDLIVGKHIGKMMSALGGRLGAYRDALATGNGPQLADALRRNLYPDAQVSDAAVTAAAQHLADLYARLKALPVSAILQGDF